jgi:hypothetical protein
MSRVLRGIEHENGVPHLETRILEGDGPRMTGRIALRGEQQYMGARLQHPGQHLNGRSVHIHDRTVSTLRIHSCQVEGIPEHPEHNAIAQVIRCDQFGQVGDQGFFGIRLSEKPSSTSRIARILRVLRIGAAGKREGGLTFSPFGLALS